MGIQGLLPMLKEIQVHSHISDFKGKRLAIDGYVWLHKGAFGCAEQLVKGEKTTRFVDYAMHRIRMLRYYGITPYMVFDGGPLPAKKGTEVSRAKSRAEYLAKARALESQKRHREARECYTKCLDITPELAYQLIKALRADGVDYVVAPYEADAQLCFLEREGFVDGIITEDSDLLVFGCRQVIFKLDGDGKCVSVHRDRFSNISEFPMHGWTDLQFRRMAMLSGCDYLPSIPGIGIKTAHRLLRRYKTVEKLIQSLRLEGSHSVPDNYAADFSQAELAFVFQRVYHPAKRCLVPLNDFPEEGLKEEDEKWVGLDVAVDVARGMAAGDINPETRLAIVDPFPDYQPAVRSTADRNASPVPLQPSKIIAGPMDAFITRATLPRPIGSVVSGPSRLSDQHILLSKSTGVKREAGEGERTRPVRSKFFGGGNRSAVQQLEDAIREAKEEMVWERSDGPDIESQLHVADCPPSSPGPVLESLRSPTPVLSPCRSSPPPTGNSRGVPSQGSSRCSTPTLSSPAHAVELRGGTSPDGPNKRCRSHSPSSPTRARAERGTNPLVPATQVEEESLESVVTETVLETPRLGHSSRLSLQHSVLIPPSSPFTSNRAIVATSSDSIEDEEIVTPSMEMPKRLPRLHNSAKRKTSGPTRKVAAKENTDVAPEIEDEIEDPDEVDSVEERRKKKAKIVAAGWKKKYAITSAAFPKPGRTRVHKDAPEHTDGMYHDPVFSPPRRPLAAQEPNVPAGERGSRFEDRLREVVKEEGKAPARSPVSAFQPGKMFPSLDKFRFTGKIKVRID